MNCGLRMNPLRSRANVRLMQKHLAVGLAAFASVAACATAPTGPKRPDFHRHTEFERWFSVPTRCGQGPYEIELTTVGGRWEEVIELQIESRQRLRLTGAISIDEAEVVRHTMTVGGRLLGPPENQFCVAPPADVAQAVQQPSTAPVAAGATTGPGAAAPVEPSAAAAELLPAEGPPNGGWPLVSWRMGNFDGTPGASRRGGQRVRLRLWSDVPNDFQGVRIGALQRIARPDSDQEYDTWVVERTRWDQQEAARRAAARTPAEAAADQKRADEFAAKQADALRDWEAHCKAQPDDTACLSAAEAAARDAKQSPDPPPPPRAEPAIPKPSQNAEWRPGYWHRAGSAWIWIAGLWRVPDEDIRAERTVHAPAPPPAAPTEAAPAAPAPATVWTPGFWQWTGSGWTWVAGSWQLPPTANLHWQPPRWINRGGVFIFLPGHWVSGPRP